MQEAEFFKIGWEYRTNNQKWVSFEWFTLLQRQRKIRENNLYEHMKTPEDHVQEKNHVCERSKIWYENVEILSVCDAHMQAVPLQPNIPA